ncbi:carcinoembryonic antigen-related cell adhesion molecule 1 isoform X1 [Ailuropoda melanoleuca]|uniref:carcinoembryonic antigen-related cell adhesion molecule 1 isoform X1 n=1 Tax=Ailuropoda melanoleuca TaxID=9646 RepID=UPI001494F69A|nr:carcinoembryonic antigen-related cell adhesion molecule 1 isoform X1 [Ailuropoda melanoleuca]
MEFPSAPPQRGHVPWQDLLLAVSLLTFWNPPTTAQVTVESVPPNAAEGKDVLLRVHRLPGDLVGLSWFRGASIAPSRQILSYVVDTQVTTPGPAHSGRETIYPNGSPLLRRVTLNDTGNYTLQIVRTNTQVEQGTGQIRVFHGPDAPTISPSDSQYRPGASLRLSCHAASNPPARYSWLINGRPQPSTQELFIPNLTANDSGAYTCIASNSGTHLNKTTVQTITVSGHGPANSSTSPDSLPSPTTAIPIYQELQQPDANIYCKINHKAEMAS